MTKDKPKEESAAPKAPSVGPGLKIGEDGRTYARIRDIDPRHNIRTVENDAQLQELAGSIKMLGVRSPLSIVRGEKSPWPTKAAFVLLDGGRRLGASKVAGLEEVPVQDESDRLTPEQMRTWQIVANLQRKDLSPMEEATAMKEWLDTTKKSTVDLGKEIGKSDDYVRSRVNLIKLPAPAVKAIEQGKLTVRHGMAFNKIPDEFKAEREAFVKDVLEDRYYTPTAEETEQDAIALTKRLRKEKEEAKKIESFKFRTCPDKSHMKTNLSTPPPADGLVFGTDATLECSSGHRWSGKTGKLMQQAQDTYERPKKQAVEKIDRSETPVVRSPHDLVAIAIAILKAAGSAGIEDISYSAGDELRVSFKVSAKAKGMPDAAFGMRALAYSSGQKTQVVCAGFDTKERRAEKKAFEAWQSKALPKVAKSPRASTKKADPKMLEGAVSEVVGSLSRVKDGETMELIRDLEAEGKARGGVFDAIDMRLGVSQGNY